MVCFRKCSSSLIAVSSLPIACLSCCSSSLTGVSSHLRAFLSCCSSWTLLSALVWRPSTPSSPGCTGLLAAVWIQWISCWRAALPLAGTDAFSSGTLCSLVDCCALKSPEGCSSSCPFPSGCSVLLVLLLSSLLSLSYLCFSVSARTSIALKSSWTELTLASLP